MDIYKDLQYHFNKLYNLKNTMKNIIDTDKDGVNDIVEIRTSDGQLKTNPDMDDIKKAAKELENMERKVDSKLNELKSKGLNKNIKRQRNRTKEKSR